MKRFIKRAVLVLMGAAVLCAAWQYRSSRMQQDIAKRILRFHVIANSDTKEDQRLKLKIRDSVGAYLHEKLLGVDGLEECIAVVNDNLAQIEAAAAEVVEQEGYGYQVTAAVADVDFPVKSYGSYTFPKGNYQALEVVIGDGAGKNWWCVMYPNMCFSSSVYEVIDENARQELKRTLTEDEYAQIMAEGKLQVKLKYLEKLKELFSDSEKEEK